MNQEFPFKGIFNLYVDDYQNVEIIPLDSNGDEMGHASIFLTYDDYKEFFSLVEDIEHLLYRDRMRAE